MPFILFKQLFLFICFVSLGSKTSSIAQKIPATNQNIYDFSHKIVKRHQQLAEIWAPQVYADCNIVNGRMHKANANVSPFFDGNRDLTDNPKTLYKRDCFKAQMLYAIIETASHYYIFYTKYNAVDLGYKNFFKRHAQDSKAMYTLAYLPDKKTR